MLTAFIQAAMRHATYEIIEDDATFFGHIPELQGVWGHAATLEACREGLQSALEDWITFSLANNLPIPPIDGIELHSTRAA
ncbi:MAG: type II toxin-antitoxin system HicB family antitoxin [Chloroflexota bacterium]|nr:MAG: type II toxin-antitoxin system HicB family antitoxin [Chloroflexota bacterium]